MDEILNSPHDVTKKAMTSGCNNPDLHEIRSVLLRPYHLSG